MVKLKQWLKFSDTAVTKTISVALLLYPGLGLQTVAEFKLKHGFSRSGREGERKRGIEEVRREEEIHHMYRKGRKPLTVEGREG